MEHPFDEDQLYILRDNSCLSPVQLVDNVTEDTRIVGLLLILKTK
jgi:hypothetical protein